MHIGSVRTALYAYLTAKAAGGEFWLRIEDTDQNRIVPGSVEDFTETLKWLGLNFDHQITQSERKDTYAKYAKQLVDEGIAYEKDGAIWFKMGLSGKTVVKDLVGDRTFEFENENEKDFVILKSDGFPTYHLAHVVDDHLDEMNPVIRAPEWVSSLPKHIQLFNSFGWEPPMYAHLTMILGTDRSKLSKRHGAKAASEYRKDGFLPESILNYMALLGWTPKSGKEILTLDEMASEFELKDTHVANAVFDTVKLEWMNGEYIRKTENSKLKTQIWEYLQNISEGKLEHPNEDEIEKVVPLVKERIKKLSDFIPLTNFIWEEPEYDSKVIEGLEISDWRLVLGKITGTMEKMERPWTAEVFEKTFRSLADQLQISAKQIFQLIRVAISGQLVTPPLFETIEILGYDQTLARIRKVGELNG